MDWTEMDWGWSFELLALYTMGLRFNRVIFFLARLRLWRIGMAL
jgi:hypothetical protein